MSKKFYKEIIDEQAYRIGDKVYQGFEIKGAMSKFEEFRFQELLDFIKGVL